MKAASHNAKTTVVIPGLSAASSRAEPGIVFPISETDSGFRAARGPGKTTKNFKRGSALRAAPE